jgi:murein DD-endopeptidase MepM/ murein hydrolase activator NlpD
VASGWASPRGTGSTRRLHRALDIGLPIGTPILAVDEGIVTYVQSQDIGDAGIWTAIRHPSGVTSRYIHLSRTLVKLGQRVQRGERIGLSGDTASKGVPHLHLDLRAPAAMLSSIEAAIGRPRSGWGPEMKPFGHSIPGEPFVAVDAYREIVRAEAAAMAIPLRDPKLPRNRWPVHRRVGARWRCL